MEDNELAFWITACIVLSAIGYRFKKRADRLEVEIFLKQCFADAREKMFNQLWAQGSYDTLTNESPIEEFHNQFRPVRKFFIYNDDFCYCNNFNFKEGTVVIYPCFPFKPEFELTLQKQDR